MPRSRGESRGSHTDQVRERANAPPSAPVRAWTRPAARHLCDTRVHRRTNRSLGWQSMPWQRAWGPRRGGGHWPPAVQLCLWCLVTALGTGGPPAPRALAGRLPLLLCMRCRLPRGFSLSRLGRDSGGRRAVAAHAQSADVRRAAGRALASGTAGAGLRGQGLAGHHGTARRGRGTQQSTRS